MPSILEETIERAAKYNDELLPGDISLKKPAITKKKIMGAFNRASGFFTELLKLEKDSGFEVTHIHGRILEEENDIVSVLYTNIPTKDKIEDGTLNIEVLDNDDTVFVNEGTPNEFVPFVRANKQETFEAAADFVRFKAQEKGLIPSL